MKNGIKSDRISLKTVSDTERIKTKHENWKLQNVFFVKIKNFSVSSAPYTIKYTSQPPPPPFKNTMCFYSQRKYILIKITLIFVFSSFIWSSGIFTKHVSSTVEVILQSLTSNSSFIISAILSERCIKLNQCNTTLLPAFNKTNFVHCLIYL